MRLTGMIGLLVLLAGQAWAAEEEERAAVEAVLKTWDEGWRTKNAELAAGSYSDDADWINAFGMRERGRAAIMRRLQEVFALPFVMRAQSRVVSQEVRFVNPGVAVVITEVEREGQKTPSGEDLGVRRTSHQRVLAKQDGRWRVVSHLIADARDPRAPGH